MTDSASVKYCTDPEHARPNPLPVSAFGKDRSKRDGLTSRCKTCKSRQNAQYREGNRETINEQKRRDWTSNPEKGHERHRRYRLSHPGKSQETSRRWRRANPGKRHAQDRRYRVAHPERERARDRRRNQAARDAVLDHYGRVCACCGSTEKLSIDHVNGGGTAHRIKLFGRNKASREVYRWLVRNGFPDGFQVLCMSCNCSKGNGTACRLDHSAAA